MHRDQGQAIQKIRAKSVSTRVLQSEQDAEGSRTSPGRVVLLSSALYLSLIVLWSIQIPFDEAPDEVTHFFFPEYLVAFHSIPALSKVGVQFVGALSGSQYSTNSEWYIGSAFLHSIGGAITGAIGLSILGPAKAFYGVRAFNWLMAAISAAALSAIAVNAKGSRIYRAGIVIAALSIPQVTFVFSYFNHDALGFAAACVLIYLTNELWRRRRLDSVLVCSIGLTIGVLSLAKVYYWPVAVFVIARLAFRFGRRGSKIGRSLSATSIIYLLFPGLLVALPFHLWNWMHYRDFTGAAVNQRFHELHPEMTPQAFNICFLMCKNALVDANQLATWLWTTFQSFFGVFGYMSIQMPSLIYSWYLVPICVVTFLLICLSPAEIVLRRWNCPEQIWDVVLLSGMSVGLLFISIWNSQTYANQPQGRYLFAFIPVVASTLINQASFAQRLTWSRKFVDNARTTCVFAIGLSMLWLNMFVLTNVVARTYGSVGSLRRDSMGLAQGIKAAVQSQGALSVQFGESHQIVGNIDRFEHNSAGHYLVTGWAADMGSNRPADAVVAFVGGQLLAAAVPNILRVDVSDALGRDGTKRSGFQLEFDADPYTVTSYCDVQLFATSASSGVAQFTRLGTNCNK
ncbi:hypothetical protein ACVWWO_001943 [Bradyrhizobium sp. F1.13.1]